MPGPIATTAASASRDVARDRERGVDRDRLEVAAERVPARDGGVDEAPVAQRRRRGRTARAAARRRRSSRRRGGRPGARSLNAAATAGSWLCSAAATTGMPSIDSTSASASRCSSVLPTSVWRLVYRPLMMWPGPVSLQSSRARFQCTTCQPPVPSPSSTAVVFTTTRSPSATGPVSCVQRVGALGAVAEIDLDALQPGALLEQRDDLRRSGTTASSAGYGRYRDWRSAARRARRAT